MTGILTVAAMLLGGLTFFLYGMSTMSSGLEQMAGGGLERTMNKVAANDFSGFFLGAGITVAIQSSSAFTVMLVGLVNSGILDFSNTFGMIMGSNVGTTLTAWLLSLIGVGEGNFFITLLQPTTFAPLLAFFGIVIRMLSKSNKKQDLGLILIGFAILIFGMDLMSSSMDFIRDNYEQEFTAFLGTLKSPIIALLISTVFTGVIQSSAATIGIVQALALSGSITWEMAIPLVLGANIGTCVTALISSVGTNKNAKKVVVMHFFVNVFGSVLCMIILYVLKAFDVTLLVTDIAIWGVAVVHTLFNAINTIILLPIKKLIIKFCEFVVGNKGEEKKSIVFLDERLFNNPPLVLSECRRLVGEMAEYSRDALLKSVELLDEYDEKKSEYIIECEAITDKYEDKLGTYLVRLSTGQLSESDSHAVSRMLHSIGDFERICDHALNVRDLAEEIKQKKIVFSKQATAELQVVKEAVVEILTLATDSFVNDDAETAGYIEPIEQVIDKLKIELKTRHIERLQKGECTVQLGFVFNDLLANFERVSDHCSNIAVYTIQKNSPKLDTHKYLRNVKTESDGLFVDRYNEYKIKYSVENI